VPAVLAARLSRRVGGVPRAPVAVLPRRRDGSGWSAGREGLQPGDCGGDLAGPGPAFGEAEPQAPAAADEAPGDGEQAQPQALGFPAAGGPRQGKQLRPGQQLVRFL
jgi:hypothetical protein